MLAGIVAARFPSSSRAKAGFAGQPDLKFTGFYQSGGLYLVCRLGPAETRCSLVLDRVLMNAHTDTIIELPFPALGIPLGIGVAQFLFGQVKTD